MDSVGPEFLGEITAMRSAILTNVSLPDFGSVGLEPILGAQVYQQRHERLLERMAIAKLDALVIYGDREHVANISWASGYDPRFEEAIYVVVPGQLPRLLAGNEGFPYAELAKGRFNRVLWQQLSLMGQPRDKDKSLPMLLQQAGLQKGMKIGLAGWKGFETNKGEFNPNWFETPHYLVENLKEFGSVTNAALLFMNPSNGLRVNNEASYSLNPGFAPNTKFMMAVEDKLDAYSKRAN